MIFNNNSQKTKFRASPSPLSVVSLLVPGPSGTTVAPPENGQPGQSFDPAENQPGNEGGVVNPPNTQGAEGGAFNVPEEQPDYDDDQGGYYGADDGGYFEDDGGDYYDDGGGGFDFGGDGGDFGE